MNRWRNYLKFIPDPPPISRMSSFSPSFILSISLTPLKSSTLHKKPFRFSTVLIYTLKGSLIILYSSPNLLHILAKILLTQTVKMTLTVRMKKAKLLQPVHKRPNRTHWKKAVCILVKLLSVICPVFTNQTLRCMAGLWRVHSYFWTVFTVSAMTLYSTREV